MKKILFVLLTGIALSGCYMVPLALIGPATSGFTSASVLQAALTQTTNSIIKKQTGKTISEHAFDAINQTMTQHSFAYPEEINLKNIYPKKKPRKEI